MQNAGLSPYNQVISFGDVLRWLRPVRWALAIGATVGALSGWGISQVFRPIYRAQTTMIPAKSPEADSGLGGIASQVGGLAALAGINLTGNDSQIESFEYLKSRALTEQFIASHDLLPLLFPKKWDVSNHRWRENTAIGIPTMTGAIRKVRNRIIRITQDKVSGLVGVSVEWYDAPTAQSWANDYVRMANDALRARTIRDTEATLAYLTRELNDATSVQVRESLSKVVESQLKTLALAKVRDDYAFRVVDRAGLPDKDDIISPQRAVFAGAGIIVGAALFAWGSHRRSRRKAKS